MPSCRWTRETLPRTGSAGALISILVSSDYASVRTEELGNDQYRYHVAVDWARLDALAERMGLPPVAQLLTDIRPVMTPDARSRIH